MTRKKEKSSQVVWIVVGIVVVLFVGFALVGGGLFNKITPQVSVPTQSPSPFDFANITIPVYGNGMKFVNGSFSDPSGETAQITNESVSPSGTRGAAIMIDSPGGSGVFYSVIGGMNENGKITYSPVQPLGDRIKIVSVSVEDPGARDNGEIIVEYLTRPENAPMSDDPTVQATKKYSFEDNGNLIEVLN